MEGASLPSSIASPRVHHRARALRTLVRGMEIVLFESTVRPWSVLSKSTDQTRAGEPRTLVRGMEYAYETQKTIWRAYSYICAQSGGQLVHVGSTKTVPFTNTNSAVGWHPYFPKVRMRVPYFAKVRRPPNRTFGKYDPISKSYFLKVRIRTFQKYDLGWNRTLEEYDLVENRTFEEYDFGLIRTFRKYEFVLSESTVPYFRKVQIILKKYGPELKSKKGLTVLIFLAY